ncbi:MAG: hypothetical protein BZY88_08705 [SAR202 cluster bacterium Io17-Chloro-G9]|nr:MAG: hypothetical protein BZY88_08705 [SAR202 cluster bacterium Io17-Chloro-G9]
MRDPDGVNYWFLEHYERGRTMGEHVSRLTELDSQTLTWYGDPSAAHQIADLRRNRFSVLPANNDVQVGMDALRYALDTTAERPWIRLHT